MSIALHNVIEKYNILKKPTEHLSSYLGEHRALHKAVMIANHIFRAIAMAALMIVLPFSPLINACICFVGSIFYRLTVENNCAYKFALPAFAGGSGLLMGMNGAASLAGSCLSWIPFTAYAAYIALTVNYDVNSRS